MSASNQEKMINALQEQQAHWLTITLKVMETSIKLFELNARMAKQSIEEMPNSIQHLAGAKERENIFKLNSQIMQATLNRMMLYTKEINAISSEFNDGIYRMSQNQFHDACEKAAGLVADAHPASSLKNNQQPFDFMASALDNANRVYQQWIENSSKFTEAVEHNLAPPNTTEALKKRVHH